MTGECSLCGLATPSPPVTDETVDGSYCCRGCLEVADAVEDAEGLDQEAVRDRREAADPLDAEPPDGLAETYLGVDGMYCSTCEAFLALRGEAVEGVHAVSASYATETARVRYDPDVVDAGRLPAALSGAGYDLDRRETGERPGEGADTDDGTAHRLLVGGVFAFLIMPWYLFVLYPRYVGLETGILTVDATTPVGLFVPMAMVGVFALVVVCYTGWPILRGAYASLRTGRPNMHLLLAVAVVSAYAYSTVALVAGSVHLYYDVAVAIVLVVTAGSYYEGRLKARATGMLADLTAMDVAEATQRRADGSLETVDVAELSAGEEVLVRPGERVPVDGTVLEGAAAVDEAVVTGEALTNTKEPGDAVVGGGLVTDRPLVVRVGEDADSTLERLTAMLWAVQSERPGVQRFADRLATVFVPLVLVVGVAVGAWRLLEGAPASAALLAGLTVLVAACPCAMGLATPLAMASGLRDALERGVVVTDGSLFERAPDVDTLVLDKTGTLTTGEMTVRSVVGDHAALRAAAAAERRSGHPVADAIVEHVRAAPDGGRLEGSGSGAAGGPSVTGFERHPGEGISARVDGEAVVVGTPALVERLAGPVSGDLSAAVSAARADGHRPVVVATGDRARAVAAVGDREREDWAAVLSAFDDERIVVLTGDDSPAAERFGEHPAVDEVFAGVPPDGKVATVRRLGADGTVAMVGDGTNDAPALGAAAVGIALDGTATAAEAADAVVRDGSLTAAAAVFELAAGTRRRIRENVAWALCYNGVAIPLAAAGLLNPLAAALAMATSSLLVVANSRRPVL